jgi:hypothetical protein
LIVAPENATTAEVTAGPETAPARAPVQATALGLPNQALAAASNGGRSGSGDVAGEAQTERDAALSEVPEALPSWLRYVMGLDQEFSRTRRALHDQFFPGGGASAAQQARSARARLLARESPAARLLGETWQVVHDGIRPLGRGLAAAVDAAIDVLWPGESKGASPPAVEVVAQPLAADGVNESPAGASPREGEWPPLDLAVGPKELAAVSLSLVVAGLLVRRAWRRRVVNESKLIHRSRR